MPTPAWTAAVTGQPGNAGQVDQFLGTHGIQYIYTGAAVVSDTSIAGGQTPNATFTDQPFTMVGTSMTRVILNNNIVNGTGADVLVAIYADAAGSPTGAALVSTVLPATFVPGLISVPLPLTGMTNGIVYHLVLQQMHGASNLLTANQASLETDTTGWALYNACTIARSTAQALDGVASLALTATSVTAGFIAAYTTNVPVTPGATYTALINFRAQSVGRASSTHIFWVKADGTTASTVRASDASASVTITTTGWTQVALTVVSPADAAFAQVSGWVDDAAGAIGDVFYFDEISLAQGTSTVWGPGGNFITWAHDTGTVGFVVKQGATIGTLAALTYTIYFQIVAGTKGPLIHTYEDAGARWAYYFAAASQFTNVLEYTVGQNGSATGLRSSRALGYVTGILTSVT